MSETTQADETSPTPSTPLSSVARWERWTTIAAIILTAIAAIYLYVTLFSAHEVCYGLSARKLLCQPLGPAALETSITVWGYLTLLFGATAIGTWWHAGATEPSQSSTAYGLAVTSWLVLILMIIPAVTGSGLYLIPASVASTASVVLATVKFFQDFQAGRAAERAQAAEATTGGSAE